MKTAEEKRIAHRDYMRLWGYNNRARKREIARASYERNRMPYLNRAVLARAGAKNAAPPWLTAQHWQEIAEVYLMAQRATEITGVLHVVDHVWPLKGQKSCGLHVPWNLQIITQGVNTAKGDREPAG